MSSDGGKGSAPRPFSVDQDSFADNWERTFGKKKSVPVTPTVSPEEEIKNTRYNQETQEVKRFGD